MAIKRVLLAMAAWLAVAACNHPAPNSTGNIAADFDAFRNKFIDSLWTVYPGWATSIGYHKYDSALVIPNAASRQKELAFTQWVEGELKRFEFDSLNVNDKTDYKLVQSLVDGVRFSINEFKSYEWDPSNYNVGGSIFDVIDYKQLTLEEKLRALSIKLSHFKAYFEAARQNIHQPTKEHTRLAAAQNKGTLYFFQNVLKDSLKASALSKEEKELFQQRADTARAAIENYIAWLEKDLLPGLNEKTSRPYAIGKNLYAKKFKMDIYSSYPADEMYQKAVARKDYLHAEMARLADTLWPKYFAAVPPPATANQKIRQLIDKISLQHCKAEDFMPTIEKQLTQLEAFIKSHNIIDLDSSKPLKVRKTPAYMEGVAGASINPAGPYDKNAATYYNVTPLTSYTPAEAESYLREYNDYVLQILNMHEAIPGHYTQCIYANRSPSIIKAVLGNGAMIEGWACYVERMMMEEGYSTAPEMQLFYYKWNLREACNFILDYNIHCNNWSEKQVMDLLVNEAFQQATEAKEKFKRASLTQVQLTSYFTGLTEIYELREEIKKKQGAAFDLKKFHEQFLSYGSAPVKEIRALMLQQ